MGKKTKEGDAKINKKQKERKGWESKKKRKGRRGWESKIRDV